MTSWLNKLSKVNESITVNRYCNGWMIEVGGRDKSGDYLNLKILCNTEEDATKLITEWNTMELDS